MKNRSDYRRKFQKIITDKTSGSTDILIKLNSLLLKNISDDKSINIILSKAKKELSHFEIIINYIAGAERILAEETKRDLKKYFESVSDPASSVKDIYARAKPYLEGITSLLTLSYSRTVAEFIKLWKADLPSLRIIICESRPKREGRKLASELLESRIRTEFITDAEMGIFIPGCDAVLIGADSVLSNGNVVNKAGSLSAAVLCKEYSKPFYVAADARKNSASPEFHQKEQPPDEVWKRKEKNLKIRNFYFEEVDKKFITRIFD